MSQKLYSVYDIRAKQFGIPFVQHNDSLAQRTVASTLVNCPPTHIMYMFPSDYELYYLGEVMDNGNLVSPENGPQSIAYLNDIVSAYKVEAFRKRFFEGGMMNDLQKQDEQTENDAQ